MFRKTPLGEHGTLFSAARCVAILRNVIDRKVESDGASREAKKKYVSALNFLEGVQAALSYKKSEIEDGILKNEESAGFFMLQLSITDLKQFAKGFNVAKRRMRFLLGLSDLKETPEEKELIDVVYKELLPERHKIIDISAPDQAAKFLVYKHKIIACTCAERGGLTRPEVCCRMRRRTEELLEASLRQAPSSVARLQAQEVLRDDAESVKQQKAYDAINYDMFEEMSEDPRCEVLATAALSLRR